jgi:drug/metabolite transporter (DMT)-like permease
MLLMMFSTLCFTAMQAMIRMVATEGSNPLPPVEVAFFRNLFGLMALLPLVYRAGPSVLRTRRLGLHALRAGSQSLGMLAFFTAVTLVPLAEVTALSFSAPLFATVLAVLVMGERIRVRRVSALVIGFVGVIVVLRPGVEAISFGAALVIGSSLLWAVAMTMIKSLSRTDSPLTLTVYAALFMSPITLVPALFVWEWPSLAQVAWLVLVGVCGSAGHMAFAKSFQMAEMSAVLPLDFLRLVWASAIGFMVFSESPTVWSWAGGVLIFSAATYIAFREAKLRSK